MGGLSSRNKGKRGEREVITLLQPIVNMVYREHGLEPPNLQRNLLQAHQGGSDIHGLLWLSAEVKLHKTPSVNSWWQQTLRQCNKGQTPVLFYRRNNEDWKVVMMLGVFVAGAGMSMRATISIDDFLHYFRRRLVEELGK